LIPKLQQPFRDLMQSVMDDVTAFNRTSCALSNFPDEHRLSREYTHVIFRDIAAAWQEFSLSANRMLLARAAGDRHAQARGAAEISS
jgi:monoamine oxidase